MLKSLACFSLTFSLKAPSLNWLMMMVIYLCGDKKLNDIDIIQFLENVNFLFIRPFSFTTFSYRQVYFEIIYYLWL